MAKAGGKKGGGRARVVVRATASAHSSNKNQEKKQLNSEGKQAPEIGAGAFTELGVYFAFVLLVFGFVILRQAPTDRHYLRRIMDTFLLQEEFLPKDAHVEKVFADIQQPHEFWEYMHGPFIANMFSDTCYGPGATEPFSLCQGRLDDNNVMFGGVRVLQFRVRPNTNFKECLYPGGNPNNTLRPCYYRYSEAWKDTASFLPPGGESLPYNLSSAFRYQDVPTLAPLSGLVGSYAGGGYLFYLNVSDVHAREVVTALEATGAWLDQGTRAVLIDTAVYNQNINIWLTVRLSVEFLSTGAVITRERLTPVNLTGNLRPASEIPTQVLRFSLLLFVLYYIWVELAELWHLGAAAYFRSGWNLLDIINLSCFVANYVFTALIWAQQGSLRLNEGPVRRTYVDLSGVGDTINLNSWVLSFNCVLTTLKMFKYLRVSDRFSILLLTLHRGGPSLANFLVVLLIFALGYTMAFYNAFRLQMEAFHTPQRALLSLAFSLVSDFGYSEEMHSLNKLWGSVLSLSFMGFVILVALNMFIAILDDAFDEVKSELDQRTEGDPVVHAMRMAAARGWASLRSAAEAAKKTRPQKLRRTTILAQLTAADFLAAMRGDLPLQQQFEDDEQEVTEEELAAVEAKVALMSAKLTRVLSVLSEQGTSNDDILTAAAAANTTPAAIAPMPAAAAAAAVDDPAGGSASTISVGQD